MQSASETRPGAAVCAADDNRNLKFRRVYDGRKRPVPALWQRGEKFYARLRVDNGCGATVDRRIPLVARTVAEARLEIERLRVKRADNTLGIIALAPTFADHSATYLADIKLAKRPCTVALEGIHVAHLNVALGQTRLNRITKGVVLRYRNAKLAAGWTGRTANLNLTVLRNVLRHAQDHGLIHTLPTDGIRPLRHVPPKRSLVTRAELDRLCEAALHLPVSGRVLADYLRLMATCGSGATKPCASRGLTWIGSDANSRLAVMD
jgi:hypothetical protein